MKPKLRPMGEITTDLEVILEEMIDAHELQAGEVLNLIYGWIKIHRPNAIEEYTSGGNPVFNYGPSD